MGDNVRFWTHRQLARNSFHHLNILFFAQEFDYADWEMVYGTLRGVPSGHPWCLYILQNI